MYHKNYNIVGFLKKNCFFEDSNHKKLSSSLYQDNKLKQIYHYNQKNQWEKQSKPDNFQKIKNKQDQNKPLYLSPQKNSNNFLQNSTKKSLDRMQQTFFSKERKQTFDYSIPQEQESKKSIVRSFSSKKIANQCLSYLSQTVQKQIQNINTKIAKFEKILYQKIDEKMKILKKILYQTIDQLLVNVSNQVIQQSRVTKNEWKQSMIQTRTKLLENQQYIQKMQIEMNINWMKAANQFISQNLQDKIKKLVEKSYNMKIQYIQEDKKTNIIDSLKNFKDQLSLIMRKYLRLGIFYADFRNA